MSETINREAHDKTKGFRLQKLRAVRLILSAVEQSQIVHVYSAIECVEDVYVKSDGCERSEEYIEEDKYYAVTTTFTLNSQPVINTLVSFLDVWIDRRFDDTLTFGFYTTSVIGKENETKTIKEACIKLPSTPLLESLKDQDFTDPTVVEAASELVKIEYKKQYSTPANPNHIRQIEKFDSGMWIRFFSRIEWF